MAGGDDDGRAVHLGQRRAGRADPVEAGGDRLAVQLAGARQAHAPVDAFEQRRPEQALEVGDGAAHGRLGCVKFLCGGAETAEPGGAFEDAQMAHRRQRQGV